MKAAVLVLACLVAVSAGAQAPPPECPVWAPDLLSVDFGGNDSGCSAGRSTRCLFNELITFAIRVRPGKTIQTCDTIEYRFSNGETIVVDSTGTQITKRFAPSWRNTTLTVSVTVRNSMGSSTVQSTPIQFAVPNCGARSSGGTLGANFRGSETGCTTGAGTCRAGETVTIWILALRYPAEPCDRYTIDFGDGSAPVQTEGVNDESGYMAVQRTFSQPGTYTVRVTLPNSTVTAATLTIRVTANGEKAATPRKRAARH